MTAKCISEALSQAQLKHRTKRSPTNKSRVQRDQGLQKKESGWRIVRRHEREALDEIKACKKTKDGRMTKRSGIAYIKECEECKEARGTLTRKEPSSGKIWPMKGIFVSSSRCLKSPFHRIHHWTLIRNSLFPYSALIGTRLWSPLWRWPRTCTTIEI